MKNTVAAYLGTVGLLDVQTTGGVTIVQLGGADPRYPSLTPYSVAHEKGLVQITERTGSVTVPEVEAINRGAECVLILEGEVLLGAKQNRTLNTTVLLRPHSTTVLPVSCVERGRWSGTAGPFRPSGTFVTPGIRGKKSKSVLYNLDSAGAFRSDQAEVWEEVSSRLASAKIRSVSEDYSALQARADRDDGELAGRFPRRPGSVGIVGFIGGRVTGCDIIPDPGTFAHYFDRLVRSYALDGEYLRAGRAGDADFAEESGRFLARLRDAETKSFASPGLGTSEQFRTSRTVAGIPGLAEVSGSALIHEDSVIHLAAFAGEARRSDADAFRRGFEI